MLLCSSSRGVKWFWYGSHHGRRWQVLVDLSGDVALQAADDFALAETFGGAPFDVVAGWLVVSHEADGADVERAVGGSGAAATAQVAPARSAAPGSTAERTVGNAGASSGRAQWWR